MEHMFEQMEVCFNICDCYGCDGGCDGTCDAYCDFGCGGQETQSGGGGGCTIM